MPEIDTEDEEENRHAQLCGSATGNTHTHTFDLPLHQIGILVSTVQTTMISSNANRHCADSNPRSQVKFHQSSLRSLAQSGAR